MQKDFHNFVQKTVNYSITIDEMEMDFSTVNNAPPVGFFGINYAYGTHKESCSYKYAIYWTNYRSFEQEDGGHCFIAKYGIRIRGLRTHLLFGNLLIIMVLHYQQKVHLIWTISFVNRE